MLIMHKCKLTFQFCTLRISHEGIMTWKMGFTSICCASPYSNAVKVGQAKDIIQFGGQLATTMDHVFTSTKKSLNNFNYQL